MPCFLLPGLKWPPALVKGGSHLPTACTWKACSPGGNPLSESASSTPSGNWVSLTEPTSAPPPARRRPRRAGRRGCRASKSESWSWCRSLGFFVSAAGLTSTAWYVGYNLARIGEVYEAAAGTKPMPTTMLDHCVIHVSEWERSNKFYVEVMGAALVPRPVGYAYRFGDKQLNVHGPGVSPAEVARLPVQP